MIAELSGQPWVAPAKSSALHGWEHEVIEAIGSVISFWGFKHNHGRIWALLYLRDTSMRLGEIQAALGLSKGAVSMLIRDLEKWGVVDRESMDPDGTHRITASPSLLKMISGVIERRELGIIVNARQVLTEAEHQAQHETANTAVLERLRKMRHIANITERVLKVLVRTARMEVWSFVSDLRSSSTNAPREP